MPVKENSFYGKTYFVKSVEMFSLWILYTRMNLIFNKALFHSCLFFYLGCLRWLFPRAGGNRRQVMERTDVHCSGSRHVRNNGCQELNSRDKEIQHLVSWISIHPSPGCKMSPILEADCWNSCSVGDNLLSFNWLSFVNN